MIRIIVATALIVAALFGAPSGTHAEDLPKVIRFGGVGSGFGLPYGTGLIAIAHVKGFVADEFKGTPVDVQWNYFTATGPAINEAFANGQLDFAQYGALPSIIARANGLATRIVLSGGGTNLFAVARTDLPIASIKDLKGRRITFQKATILHWSALRVLAANGISEHDVTLLDLKTPDQLAALAAGSADASFGSSNLLTLRDRGLVKVIYTSKDDPQRTGPNGLAVTEDFERKYPDATERVTRAFVKAAAWLADESHRDEAIAMWSKSGVSAAILREDVSGQPLREEFNPRLDGFIESQYRDTIAFAKEQHLIRADVDLSQWFEPRFQNTALNQLNLAGFWPRRDGVPVN
jgi:sulfonate transport system substrate-binding protein